MADKLTIGDRVVVKDTLLYNGRVGTLALNSGEYDDPWDFTVKLEAVEVAPDASRADRIISEERTIGVHDFQVELVGASA